MLPATTHRAPTMLSALNASGVTHAKAARAPIIEPTTVKSGADAATEPTRDTSHTSRAIPNAPYATTVFTIPNINARNAAPCRWKSSAGIGRWEENQRRSGIDEDQNLCGVQVTKELFLPDAVNSPADRAENKQQDSKRPAC